VPESADTRLARLEASRDEHRELIKQVTPLVAQYAVLEERVRNYGRSLDESFETLRGEIEKSNEVTDARFKAIADKDAGNTRERRAVYTALGLSLFGLIINLALQLSGLGGGHP
jgi:hypothetical protein